MNFYHHCCLASNDEQQFAEFCLNHSRASQLFQWLESLFVDSISDIKPLTGDAGFRCYYRFSANNVSYIAVDSPTDKCDNQAFTKIQTLLMQKGLLVPTIFFHHEKQGFLCLSDLGDNLLANTLTSVTAHEHYLKAISYIPEIAQLSTESLPIYDKEFITNELSIFVDWLLIEHLNIQLNHEESKLLEQCFCLLIDNALEQPQIFVHRDYHSRNLMWYQDSLAIIDFQDAVCGPITYDIVSLLRDCYVKWPSAVINPLFQYFIKLMKKNRKYHNISCELWQRWFDLMGLQRHLKASGIFARLHHRDNKSGYLEDIPLTLSYISDITKCYPELKFLTQLVEDKILPALNEQERSK